MSAVFDAVLGRPHLNHLLESYARQPVHAYLYLGPSGSQRETAAFATAAALLCEQGGCGSCTTCQRVLGRVHPDVFFLELEGKALSVEQLREHLIPFADRRPLEGSRKIAIVPDISGIEDKAPMILKTLEEPYPGTFFILLASELTPGMATIASRCTTVQFPPVPETALRRSLEGRGLSEEQLGEIVQASLGSLNRAELLSSTVTLSKLSLLPGLQWLEGLVDRGEEVPGEGSASRPRTVQALRCRTPQRETSEKGRIVGEQVGAVEGAERGLDDFAELLLGEPTALEAAP